MKRFHLRRGRASPGKPPSEIHPPGAKAIPYPEHKTALPEFAAPSSWDAERNILTERLERARTKKDNRLAASILSVLVIWMLVFMTGALTPLGNSDSFGYTILAIWGASLVLIPSLTLTNTLLELRRIERRLREREAEIQMEYALAPPAMRAKHLRRELARLTHKTALVLLDNEVRYEQARQWRERAQFLIEIGDLFEAQSILNTLNELVLREEKELREQRNWRRLSIAIMVAYMLALVAATMSLARQFYEFGSGDFAYNLVPVFGIPYAVIMWAILGSFAAILYRFYTERERVRFDLEVRWLIARPIVGIIMGGLAYLGMVAGLLLVFGDANVADTGAENRSAFANPPGRPEVYWIVAFLAGFSDKFYERIIDLLAGKALGPAATEEQSRAGRIRATGGAARDDWRHPPQESGVSTRGPEVHVQEHPLPEDKPHH